MTTSVEEFMAVQRLVRCEPMSAQITLERCQELQKSSRYQFYCEGCTGIGKAIEIEERVTVKSSRAGKARKSRTPVATPPPDEQQSRMAGMSLLRPPPTLSMVLDFSNDADIYGQLIEKGIDEEQIIGLLSMLLDGELRRVA